MKQIFFLIVLSSLLTSCNEPTRDRRLAYSTAGSQTNGYTYIGTTSTRNDGTTTTPTPSSTSTTSNIPSVVSHCKWSTDGATNFDRSSNHLGDYTVCQSTSDEKQVYIQIKTIPSSRVCLIPTSHNGSNSTYIGEPSCVLVSSNTTIYPVSLLKNRTGYENFKITGVMIMKDLVKYSYGYPYTTIYPYTGEFYAPDAYLKCMAMLNYGNYYYCQAFNSKGEHVYHQF